MGASKKKKFYNLKSDTDDSVTFPAKNRFRKENIDTVIAKITEYTKNVKAPVMEFVKIMTNDPFKILVGTLLSSRTNDNTTSKVLANFFMNVEKADDINDMSVKELEELIFPVGFYRTKAKHLKELPIVLKNKFNGIIPETIEELVQLPGVGRKTANLVMILAFEQPAMCVDVHVHRISNRIGIIKTKNPLDSELALREVIPLKYWMKYNFILVAFGQNLCKPTFPRCTICPVEKYCEKYSVNLRP